MSQTYRVNAILQQALGINTLGGLAYEPVNPGGIEKPCYRIKLINTSTNRDVLMNFTGGAGPGIAQDIILMGQTLELYSPMVGNSVRDMALFPKGLVVYVICPAGGNGYIEMSGYYIE
jgi:hypothetical protein